MINHDSPNFYRVCAVAKPEIINDLIFCLITLKNMRGETKTEKIVFANIFEAFEFYGFQNKMLLQSKNKGI